MILQSRMPATNITNFPALIFSNVQLVCLSYLHSFLYFQIKTLEEKNGWGTEITGAGGREWTGRERIGGGV